MTPSSAIKSAAVFVPPIGPVGPDILAVLALFARVRVILDPMLKRIEAGQPAFIEAVEEAPELAALIPNFAAALRTYDKLMAIGIDYAEKVEKAAQS